MLYDCAKLWQPMQGCQLRDWMFNTDNDGGAVSFLAFFFIQWSSGLALAWTHMDREAFARIRLLNSK